MRYIKQFQKENHLVPDGIIGKYTIKKMMEVFGIETKTGISHFLGQVAVETMYFEKSKENLMYSAKRLLEIFPRYFNNKTALVAAYRPEFIANRVYNDKYRIKSLGNIHEGDGFKFIGRGALQITGRRNYQEFADWLGDDIIIYNPDLVSECYFWQSALWFFDKRNIWSETEKVNYRNIKRVSRLVNGGDNGLQERVRLTKHFYNITKTYR